MRRTQLHAPTRREAPQGTWSEGLATLVRGGYLRVAPELGAVWLPLGTRLLRRVTGRLTAALASLPASEVRLPPDASLGDVTHGVLGPELRSYRQLPVAVYAAGEHLEAHVLLASADAARSATSALVPALGGAVAALGLELERAPTGPEPGSVLLAADTTYGGVRLLHCASCDRVVDPEVAPASERPGGEACDRAWREVETPDQKTVAEVTAFLGVPASRLIKTLVLRAGDELVAALVRGDHELSVSKLAATLGLPAHRLTLAGDEEVLALTGAPVGFAGPVGLDARLVVDRSVSGLTGAVCGANRADAHLVDVAAGRDFTASVVADLRAATASDPCAGCGSSQTWRRVAPLVRVTAGAPTSSLTVSDPAGQDAPVWAVSASVDVAGLVEALAEQHGHDGGLRWPATVAPFEVAVLSLGRDGDEVSEAAEAIYRDLIALGVDALLDDTGDRAGAKFATAELMGHPHVLVVGRRTVARGSAEWRDLAGGEVTDVRLADAARQVAAAITGAREPTA